MIASVVLAAGGSRRFGEPKPLLRLDGRSLLERAVQAAEEAGCAPVIVVLGAEAGRLRVGVEDSGCRVEVNPNWEEGMASSIRHGVGSLAACEPDARAVVLVAVDQPHLDAQILRRLIDAYQSMPGRVVASEYSGTVGIPAVFDRDRFPELLVLRGDRGAKAVVLRDPSLLVRVPWPEGAVDVDDPRAWEEFRNGG